jgi:hypothetical protein
VAAFVAAETGGKNMSRQLSATARLWNLPTRKFWFVGAAVLALAVPAVAQQSVMRVEEDWKLVLNDPNNGLYSPQFHTTMSPTPNLSGFYAQVLWNYKEEGDFQPGGLQFQLWTGEELTRYRDFRSESLSTSAETITWTQRLYVYGETVRFYVINGQSTTWGAFGNYILDSDHGVDNLDNYDTNISVHNSWITFGSNRVDSLVITEVRRYDINGDLISTDSTPKIVFQLQNTSSDSE